MRNRPLMNALAIAGVTALAMGMTAVPSLGASVASAGQVKVDICHVEGNGSFHNITVADPAYASHLDHGDAAPGSQVPGVEGKIFDAECNIVDEPGPVEVVFARAWLEADFTPGYDPAIDLLMAKWVDGGPAGTPDGLPGNGDSIVTEFYPIALTPVAPAQFGAASLFVDSATSFPGVCQANLVAGGSENVVFSKDARSEALSDFGPGGSTLISDAFAAGIPDVIRAESGSPLLPAMPVNLSLVRPDDQSFVDVELNCAP